MKTEAVGAKEEMARLAITAQSAVRISVLFSTRSPSGARKISPMT
ncbi:hypothetical protein BN961_00564 [Afipia felis]|uniref:Uncharacterized protein n=1 Tax=Afipia felis TaxID=1035 RepID=A0A090MI20_AFIFE|nr:hypothetical protein BN961_00564 [Afipia felis]